jgi:ABC-type multidrug transport system ATPase subunit
LQAAKGRTTIIIAHRLSTIRSVDKIIAVKDGEIAEVGTHEELIEQHGLYYDLVNAQVFTDAVDNVDKSTIVIFHVDTLIRFNKANYHNIISYPDFAESQRLHNYYPIGS